MRGRRIIMSAVNDNQDTGDVFFSPEHLNGSSADIFDIYLWAEFCQRKTRMVARTHTHTQSSVFHWTEWCVPPRYFCQCLLCVCVMEVSCVQGKNWRHEGKEKKRSTRCWCLFPITFKKKEIHGTSTIDEQDLNLQTRVNIWAVNVNNTWSNVQVVR